MDLEAWCHLTAGAHLFSWITPIRRALLPRTVETSSVSPARGSWKYPKFPDVICWRATHSHFNLLRYSSRRKTAALDHIRYERYWQNLEEMKSSLATTIHLFLFVERLLHYVASSSVLHCIKETVKPNRLLKLLAVIHKRLHESSRAVDWKLLLF